MIVGFTITGGDPKKIAAFIRKYCILESPEIADNIAKLGAGVNVFSKSLSNEAFSEANFGYSLIETVNGKVIVASAVDFHLEVEYNGRIIRLNPTEYIYIKVSEVGQFREYARRKLLSFIPNAEGGNNGRWILSNAFWNDGGGWIDFENWKDV